jgi:hypothetical protein
MELKHTPGPWQKNPRHQTSINAGKKHVAMVNFYKSGGAEDVSGDEHEANSNLILAAPDLLAALIGLDDAFCSLNDNMTKAERDDARRKLIAARAAVAKATGQVPA